MVDVGIQLIVNENDTPRRIFSLFQNFLDVFDSSVNHHLILIVKVKSFFPCEVFEAFGLSGVSD
jgi:hypothetical protein